MDIIGHLCEQQAWQAAQAAGEYHTPSLEQEGFIHCSRPDQILWVANQFYPGNPELVVLWIDPGQVQPEVRWESADAQTFPHIYGPLNLEAVLAVQNFSPDPDGVFRRLPVP